MADLSPVVPRSEKMILKLRKRRKKGDSTLFKGAFGEDVHLPRTGGDISPTRRRAIQDVIKEKLRREIEKVKKRKRGRA